MQISIVNHTNGKISDHELHPVIRAINRQIKEDFAPFWGMSAKLRLEGRSAIAPDLVRMADLRGDAIIYLWDKVDVEDAVGYHMQNARGIPYGFVFTKIAEELGEHWSVTLSHEVLELIADPETNLLVMGPHPADRRFDVFHWFEMCDAVQAETYKIDEVEVSNFLLPLYFTGSRGSDDEVGARNDFLGKLYKDQTLQSFGINPGGYIGFYDPTKKKHDQFSIEGDKKAAKRLKIKSKAKQARRSVRYRTHENREKLLQAESASVLAMSDAARPIAKVAVKKASPRAYASISASISDNTNDEAESRPAKNAGRRSKRSTK